MRVLHTIWWHNVVLAVVQIEPPQYIYVVVAMTLRKTMV